MRVTAVIPRPPARNGRGKEKTCSEMVLYSNLAVRVLWEKEKFCPNVILVSWVLFRLFPMGPPLADRTANERVPIPARYPRLRQVNSRSPRDSWIYAYSIGGAWSMYFPKFRSCSFSPSDSRLAYLPWTSGQTWTVHDTGASAIGNKRNKEGSY